MLEPVDPIIIPPQLIEANPDVDEFRGAVLMRQGDMWICVIGEMQGDTYHHVDFVITEFVAPALRHLLSIREAKRMKTRAGGKMPPPTAKKAEKNTSRPVKMTVPPNATKKKLMDHFRTNGKRT